MHTAGATTITVTTTGIYQIYDGVSITLSLGSQIAIAVNVSTLISVLVATGEISEDATISFTAGDVITLRKNFGVLLTTPLALVVGARLTFLD